MLELAQDTEKLIQLVAAKTGKTAEAVVREAVEAEARHIGISQAKCKRSRDELIAGMTAIADRSAARPVLDHRPADEILGYDDHGLPA